MRPHVCTNGLVAYEVCRMPNTSIKTTKVHVALRGLTITKLEEAFNERNGKADVDNDIAGVVKTAMVKKNALLFLPYMFYGSTKFML